MNVWVWVEGAMDWDLVCTCEKHRNANLIARLLAQALRETPSIRVQVDKPTTPPTKADILVWGEVRV